MVLKHPTIQIQGHITQTQKAAFLALFLVSGERAFCGRSSGLGKGSPDTTAVEEGITGFAATTSGSAAENPTPTKNSTPKKS